MDYDIKHCNHKWEGHVDNILLNGKLIGLVSRILLNHYVFALLSVQN